MSQLSREDVRERLGNIDQIRDIIFGAQQREYENRMSKLESDISLLQQEMRSHIEQLKANLTTEFKAAFEALEKKHKSLSLSNQEEAADLRQIVERLNKKFSNTVQSLDEALDTQTTSIRSELGQTKTKLQDDVMGLRNLILEEIERRFSQLRETKVSKDDMAEILFALGMGIKGTEFIPKLREAASESNEDSDSLIIETKLSEILVHSNGSTEVHASF
ncbi:hypothetical protein ICL16_01440 [Iningainema sp. BLCCT55]|uniref:Uncharacterized protein n=2 Tax=Iningainema TaxID=1932705 RepID=A0A8J7C5H2_9CYAN|nr:hypothetical protein [Iningainema tapete BLCC-T55]